MAAEALLSRWPRSDGTAWQSEEDAGSGTEVHAAGGAKRHQQRRRGLKVWKVPGKLDSKVKA